MAKNAPIKLTDDFIKLVEEAKINHAKLALTWGYIEEKADKVLLNQELICKKEEEKFWVFDFGEWGAKLPKFCLSLTPIIGKKYKVIDMIYRSNGKIQKIMLMPV